MRNLLLAGLLLASNAHSAPSVPDIPIIHVWTVEPTIRVCPDAPGGLARWKRAAANTKRYGARWADVVESDCAPDTPVQTGDVFITHLRSADEDQAGETRMAYVMPGVAVGAIVAVRPHAAGTWTPEHELLHAQGLDHHTMTGHVLHRSLDRGGWRYDGVRAALRRAWSE